MKAINELFDHLDKWAARWCLLGIAFGFMGGVAMCLR